MRFYGINYSIDLAIGIYVGINLSYKAGNIIRAEQCTFTCSYIPASQQYLRVG